MIDALLFEVAWKSALIMAAVLLLVALMRSRPAAEKSTVVRWSILMLAFLPVATFAPGLTIEAPWLSAVALNDAVAPANGDPEAVSIGLMGACYAMGASIVLGRLLLGLVALRRWIREAAPVTAPVWAEAIAQGVGGGVRVLASGSIDAPLSCGWRRPVILIDHATLQRPQHARAILAHELAHLARADWIVLIGLHLVAALFWFNPLVWVAKHAAEQFAEEAADQHALKTNDAPDYAQALVDCACGRPVSVAVGMAHRKFLRRRLDRILACASDLTPRALVAAMAVGAAVAISLGITLTTFVAPAIAAHAPSVRQVRQVLPPVQPERFVAVLSEPKPIAPVAAPEAVPMAAPPTEPVAIEPAMQPSVGESIDSDPSTLVSAEAAPPDPRQRRWEENMRRHQARNERRQEARDRRDRARANRILLQRQTANAS